MTDRPSQWAIEQAVKLVAGVLSNSVERLSSWASVIEAIGNLASGLDAMRAVDEEPKDGLGYGGVVRSHHDGD
jgi:hypothetical protein